MKREERKTKRRQLGQQEGKQNFLHLDVVSLIRGVWNFVFFDFFDFDFFDFFDFFDLVAGFFYVCF